MRIPQIQALRALAAILAIADPVKATTPAALKALAADGLKIVMLTGDNRTTAKAVAVRLGIDEVAQAAGTVGYELMCAVSARVGFTQD